MSGIVLLYNALKLGESKHLAAYKTVTVVIPEDLDYTDVFADIFKEYTVSCELMRVKTTNMGSLFRLTYDVILRDPAREKEMIDAIRCRNGNLEIAVSHRETAVAEL